MKLFNAFQLVILLVAFPYGIQWLHSATFAGATAAFWAAIAFYVIQLIWTTIVYADALE